MAAFLAALVLSITWAAMSPVQDAYFVANSGWNGTSELGRRGFLPVSEDMAKVLSSPDVIGVLVILGPSREFSRVEAELMASFVKKGGMLIIADNVGSGNGLLELLGLPVRFDGRLLMDTLFYQKQPVFPLVFDLPQSEFSIGIDELALNHATALKVRDSSDVKVLAQSSRFSFLDDNQDGKKGADEPAGPFPVWAEVQLGKGSILLFTSPASFTNGMIHEGQNRILIENVINTRFVRASPSGTQSEVARLFLDETHLGFSELSAPKLILQSFVAAVLSGTMSLTQKLILTGVAAAILALRFTYRRPKAQAEIDLSTPPDSASPDIDLVLRLHPTWDRRTLEFVAAELEASNRWRWFRGE